MRKAAAVLAAGVVSVAAGVFMRFTWEMVKSEPGSPLSR